MKATETHFLQFLQPANQFVIPIYQRTYSWTLKQCEQLWHAITQAALDQTTSGHFLGSIVYINRGLHQVTLVHQLLVIDGQQRLTTLSLLLTALGKAIEESSESLEISREQIENYFLFNNQEKGNVRYKLLLTQSDRETFIRLIESRELPSGASRRLMENYKYFENKIRKRDSDLNSLYRGISKLLIVAIALERDDNPQLIFESLNSTGLDLSQADMIRNYVLMGLEPKEQEEIYNHYWYPMEQSFLSTGITDLFDRFIRDYLTLKSKLGVIPNIRDVYNSFKSYVQKQKGANVKEIVADVYCYSKYYVRLALEQETDPVIKQALTDINTLKVDVAYPFLLEVYEDYVQKLLTQEEFVSILRLIESYVFRRAICGIPASSMNKTFATLSREVDRDNYFESVQIAFISKDSYKRIPINEEFRREFLVKDIYNFRSRNYLLRKMENHSRTKELVNAEDYTIEHIMPQNPKLSFEWQAELGENWKEVQAKHLHTIGNLTLTGYNSEYGDRPFSEKRDMKDGFADSPLRLNQMLRKLDHWNETEIKNRAEALADLAVKVWMFPDIQLESQSLNVSKLLSSHEQYLQGAVLELFETLRKRILHLDAEVREEFKKKYIAYKINTNLVDVTPRKSSLRLYLNMQFGEIDDPQKLCKDVTNLGHWGNGDVEMVFSSLEQIDDVMLLVRQAFKKHSKYLVK